MKYLASAIAMLLTIILTIYSIRLVSESASKATFEIQEAKNNVGKKVVVEKDTCQIIDVSILHDNYVLSNGKTICIESIDKFLLK